MERIDVPPYHPVLPKPAPQTASWFRAVMSQRPKDAGGDKRTTCVDIRVLGREAARPCGAHGSRSNGDTTMAAARASVLDAKVAFWLARREVASAGAELLCEPHAFALRSTNTTAPSLSSR